MSTIPKLVNIGNIQKNFKSSVETRTKINNFNSDSIVRSIYLPVIAEIERINNENRRAFEAFQVNTATGSDLNKIAAHFGLTRLSATRADTKQSLNFMFYTDTTFGSINGGASIVIPKGTLINTVDNSNEIYSGITNQVLYEVAADYTLSSSEKIGFCSVKAKTVGANQNIGKNILANHSFTAYTDIKNSSLKCSNNYPILNGRNSESDDSLRYRINKLYASIVKDSEEALLLQSLEVPGVEKLEIIPNYFGIGTVGIFVFGASLKSNKDLILDVDRKLSKNRPPGIKYYVLSGISVFIDLDMTIYINQNIPNTAKLQMVTAIKKNITTFFNSNTLNRTSLSALRDLVISSHSGIIGITSPHNQTDIFNSVHIRKSYGESSLTSERVKLETNTISLKREEYFVLGTIDVNFEVEG